LSLVAAATYDRKMSPSVSNEPRAPVLVEVFRGALVESSHRGFIAAVDADGQLVAALGDVTVRSFFRSAAKPFQAIPFITSGAADQLRIAPTELAVIAGSHSGEAIHTDIVKSILARIGLSESDLKCGAHMPFDEATARDLRSSGNPPTPLHNNCSGKHAAMLAYASYLGERLDNYLEPAHPVQRRIREVLATFAAMEPEMIGIAIDGCSAPVFAVSVAEMARSYAQLVGCELTKLDRDLCAAAARVTAAMIEYPELVGGTKGRLDTDLMRVARGALISKVGAEGVQLLGIRPCALYPRALGIAIKIEDGDIRRARDPVVIETLRQLGLLDEEQLVELSSYRLSKILNHRGLEVGVVRTCFQL